MGEKQFENRVKEFLEKNGIRRIGRSNGVGDNGYYLKRGGGGQYIPSGIPDMQINIGALCLEVELKTDTTKPTELQKLKIEQINRTGGIAFILRPKYFADFQKIISSVIEMKKRNFDYKTIMAVMQHQNIRGWK